MAIINWITPAQVNPPPLMKDAEVADTERLAQEHGRRHALPNPQGHEEIKSKAQGVRVRFDVRTIMTLVGLLAAHAAVYADAKKDADELRAQLDARNLAERLWNVFRALADQALFGLQLREAYLTERTLSIIEHIRDMKVAGEAAGNVPPAVAAVYAGVWPAYEKLNQRSQEGQASAAALRAEGAQSGEEWRAYAIRLEERLAVAEARLRERLEAALDSDAPPPKAPARPDGDDRKARR